MSEHGSRRAAPSGRGSRGAGRRSANSGGLADRFNDLAGQISGQVSGLFGSGRGGGGGRRGGGGGYDDGDGYGPRGSGGPGRPRKSKEPLPRDWWMKYVDYPRYGRQGWRHWMPSIKQILSLSLAFMFVVIGTVAYAYSRVVVPTANHYIADGQPTQFTYDDGKTPFASIGLSYYEVKDIKTIPLVVQNAVIAAENYSFRTDPGVSFTGVARAALNDLFGSGGKQGGSTITQQYVKNAFLSQDQSFARKIDEIMISIKISKSESKDQILLGYLNQITFGRGAYGIDAASRAYFGVPVSQLKSTDVDKAAFLATMINNPSVFSAALVSDKTRASHPLTMKMLTQRYNQVLSNMSKYNFEPESVTLPLQEHLPTVIPQKTEDLSANGAGYMKEAAEQFLAQMEADYPGSDPNGAADINNLSKGGYTVVTTYNKQMMADAVTAADQGFWKDKNGQFGEWDPTNKNHLSDNNVHLAFAAVDPSTGYLKAFYTGVDGTMDYGQHAFNDALMGGVQVGSTFKPITLATALETGKYSLDSQEPGSNTRKLYFPIGSTKESDHITYTDQYGQTKNWPPNEDDETAKGGDFASLKEGLAMSLNSVFADLELEPDVTPNAVYTMARQLGIKDGTEDFKPVASLTLGTADITPMRMASAYSTFAAGGVHRNPVQVTKILNKEGKVVWTPPKAYTTPSRVMQPNTAAGVTEALQGVLQDGGTAAGNHNAVKLYNKLNGNIGGKTGTTDYNHSAWFNGFSSSLSTAVVMFRQTPNGTLESLKGVGNKDQTRVNGMSYPTSVWAAFMNIESSRKSNFAQPFSPYINGCTGQRSLVSFGQQVQPQQAPKPDGNQGANGNSNCQYLATPTPSMTPTPTPTPTDSASQPDCQQQPGNGNGGNGGGQQNPQNPPGNCQPSGTPATPTDTGTDPGGPGGGETSTPTAPSSRTCSRKPGTLGCPSSSGPGGLPIGQGQSQ
jgi:penicillin-binding protein 1A